MPLYLGSQKINKVLTEHSTLIIDTSDATATESDVLSGKTFYANGKKKNGNLIISDIYTVSTDEEPDASLGKEGDLYLVVSGE